MKMTRGWPIRTCTSWPRLNQTRSTKTGGRVSCIAKGHRPAPGCVEDKADRVGLLDGSVNEWEGYCGPIGWLSKKGGTQAATLRSQTSLDLAKRFTHFPAVVRDEGARNVLVVEPIRGAADHLVHVCMHIHQSMHSRQR